MSAERLYLIDAHALCYRAFYAIQNLRTSKGQATNAVYGVINSLKKILRDQKPHYIAACFDSPVKTHRQQKFAEYKIQRPVMPDDLQSQIPLIKDIFKGYNITVLEMGGYEADDLIATLAHRFSKNDLEVVIVTEDKDMYQLVNDKVKLYSIKKDAVLGTEEIKDILGFEPKRIVDFIGLAGDNTDNIPGVFGIGEVTARKLINEFGSIEEIYSHLDRIKPEKLKEKIVAGKKEALLSKELAVLEPEVPVEYTLDNFKLKDPDTQRLHQIFRDLEFKKFADETMGIEEEKNDLAVLSLNNDNDIDRFLERVQKEGRFTFLLDIEENDSAVTERSPRVKGCIMALKTDVAYLPLERMEILKKVLEDDGIIKVTYDLKEIWKFFALYQYKLKGVVFDVLLAAYLLRPAVSSYELSALSWDYLKRSIPQVNKPLHEAQVLHDLYAVLLGELKDKMLIKLLEEIETPLSYVLAQMEYEGVKLDVDLLSRLSRDGDAKIQKLTTKLYREAGEEFNLNSPKQLSHILFEKLKLPVVKKTKTGFSTDEEVLTKLSRKHDFPLSILEYRQLAKLKSTYIDALPRLINPESGRVHAQFIQVGTETGRLSSRNPNLQNIPIRTELGRQIRRAIVAFKEDHVMIAADYSQIELRILAHLSRDENLKKAFEEEQDIHRYTASLIFEIPENEVTDSMRDSAKRVNFGIIYGMSAFGLSQDLEIPAVEAQSFIDRYFLRYPKVKKFMDDTIEKCEECGYVVTLLNRRRYLPEINNPNNGLKQFAQRQAINTPVQGSAADLMKLAMINIQKEMEEKKLNSRMIMTVHDELVFDVPVKEKESMVKLIRQAMEHALPLSVPVKANIKVGRNWLDMDDVL